MAATKEKQQTQVLEEAEDRGNLALMAPRLVYPPVVQELFGIDKAAWKALVEARFPLAKTSDSVFLALAWCKQRKLDPMKAVCHVVPMWNGTLKRMVETVWPGIAEVRITAFRTGCYAGADETVFGPTIDHLFEDVENFEDKQGKKGKKTHSVRVSHPEWAQVTVYRSMGNGVVAKFVGPKCYFSEWYSGIKNLKVPNARWQRAPWQMIEKCAEAAALRKAFPEELGGEYIADEMEGKVIDEGGSEVQAPERPRRADFVGTTGPVTDVADDTEQDEPSPESEDAPSTETESENPAPREDDAPSAAAEQAAKRKPSFWERASYAIGVPKDGKGHEDWAKWADGLGNATRDCPELEALARLETENKASFDQLRLKMPTLGQALRKDFLAAAERLQAGEP